MENSFDAIIFGAGISGLVSTKILLSQGIERILVVDEYKNVGGNHISQNIGNYTFDIGTMIFQDDSPLLKYFPDILPLYHPIEQSITRIRPDGTVTTFPLSVKDDIVKRGPLEWVRIFSSVALARTLGKRPTDADSYARFWIGDRFYNLSGLRNYVERFYGVHPKNVELTFAEKRMAWLAESASISRLAKRAITRSPLWPPNQSLVRPRDGFDALYGPVQKDLESQGVKFKLGGSPTNLSKGPNGFEVTFEGSATATTQRLISTIPIDRMLELLGVPSDTQLPTLTLTSLFYSFSGDRRFPSPTLYNFSASGDWKRLTMFSDFYGRATGREFFGIEIVGDAATLPVDELDKRFGEHCRQMGVFVGDLKFEGHHILSNAYPVYTHGSSEQLKDKASRLKEWGVESFGRQGGFDYLPTARTTTTTAEENLIPAVTTP